ncbi:hypothetical protein [Slackia exigua]|uniref:hypothetical protein n=1 Tax=Slackia exigua TaxID=84109 RepID=UPI003AB93AED
MSDKRSFLVDFKGRIRNFNLPKDKALVPLYKAIVNSLQAIEDKGNGHSGKIAVAVNRLEVLDGGDIPEGDITGFTITDNGIGFDGLNFGLSSRRTRSTRRRKAARALVASAGSRRLTMC